MLRRHLVLAIIGCLVGLPVSSTAQDSDPLTVILVRHGEPASDDPRDPDLTEAGKARADALARMLESADVTAVYATQFRRTQQTGQPTATQAGVDLTIVEATAGAQYITDMGRRIRYHQPGEVVVVVGHANSVPPIVNVLTGRSLPDLALDQYDRMYLVTVWGDENGSLVTFRYGLPTR